MTNQTDKILKLLEQGENVEFECKKSSEKLSDDLWETYSAFANTNGGIILLGVKQKNDNFYITNISNPQKMLRDFYNTLNNQSKVSTNILNTDDVKIISINNDNIIMIEVPRASRKQRPVYINGNPLTGTFKRNFEGDYKCTEEEINRMLAEKSDFTQDHQIIDDISIDSLNKESIESYRKRFLFARGNSHPWASLSNEEFLYQLGCANKKSSQYKLTLAGLLMFGYEREITEILPNYFLDYREKDTTLNGERWSHRIISSDGSWSGNLYDFYFKIINRLTSDLAVPFKLNNSIRSDNTPIHDAIREALTNTLIHTDFRESGSILIEKTDNTFIFTNPGNLRIPKERALKGRRKRP